MSWETDKTICGGLRTVVAATLEVTVTAGPVWVFVTPGAVTFEQEVKGQHSVSTAQDASAKNDSSAAERLNV